MAVACRCLVGCLVRSAGLLLRLCWGWSRGSAWHNWCYLRLLTGSSAAALSPNYNNAHSDGAPEHTVAADSNESEHPDDVDAELQPVLVATPENWLLTVVLLHSEHTQVHSGHCHH